jgi:hypothetical protein
MGEQKTYIINIEMRTDYFYAIRQLRLKKTKLQIVLIAILVLMLSIINPIVANQIVNTNDTISVPVFKLNFFQKIRVLDFKVDPIIFISDDTNDFPFNVTVYYKNTRLLPTEIKIEIILEPILFNHTGSFLDYLKKSLITRQIIGKSDDWIKVKAQEKNNLTLQCRVSITSNLYYPKIAARIGVKIYEKHHIGQFLKKIYLNYCDAWKNITVINKEFYQWWSYNIIDWEPSKKNSTAGDNITVNVTVQNQGILPLKNIELHVYIISTSKVGISGVLEENIQIGIKRNITIMEMRTEIIPINCSIPYVYSGFYFLIVEAGIPTFNKYWIVPSYQTGKQIYIKGTSLLFSKDQIESLIVNFLEFIPVIFLIALLFVYCSIKIYQFTKRKNR